MEQTLEQIAKLLEKNCLDYVGIFSPIILSVLAIMISIWNSFIYPKLELCEANMVWDDLNMDFYIFIRNIGKKTLVIKSVSLFAYDDRKNKYELGTRQNAWTINKQKGYIEENEAVLYVPDYGSIYDVFAYRGHYFDVSQHNRDWKVRISVTAIDNKKWTCDTSLTLGDIEDRLISRN